MSARRARRPHDVALVPWPTEGQSLETLRQAGQPRLLLIRGDGPPPLSEDALEDWVRVPADPVEVQARVATLEARALRGVSARLDENGRLHVGSRWVALSPIEHQLATPLVEHFGGLVSHDTLLRAGWPHRHPSRNQLDVQILRLRRRIESVGLRLRTVRSRGYSLDHSGD